MAARRLALPLPVDYRWHGAFSGRFPLVGDRFLARVRIGTRVAGWCGLTVLWAGCAGPSAARSESPASAAALSLERILAPVDRDDRELQELKRSGGSPYHVLRSAYILLRTGDPEESLSLLNRLLYVDEQRSPAVAAYAYYVRALAWEVKGNPERAAADRKAARELALDADLRQRIASHEPATPTATERVATPTVQRLPRQAWGARRPVPRNMDAMGKATRMTIHHSAILAQSSERSTVAAIQSIQREHMEGRDFGDIGYHWLIDPAGRIWAGRDPRYQGAHSTGGNNVGNLGICLLGNFIPGSAGQRPTPAQNQALRELLLELAREYRIGSSHILTHRELRPTDCPGDLLQAVVDQIRRDWAQLAASM